MTIKIGMLSFEHMHSFGYASVLNDLPMLNLWPPGTVILKDLKNAVNNSIFQNPASPLMKFSRCLSMLL